MEYRRFAAAILDELHPQGPLEEELAGDRQPVVEAAAGAGGRRRF